ncbi:Probable chromosome-partitioning protein parB [Moraxella caviae]|nr:Probable chromosome-partitioning protein parB [Moraxella caviae]
MKKRGLGNSRGLGALISGVKKERALTAEALVATADGLPASAEKIAELAGGSKDKSAKSKADVKADKADKADKKAKTKKDAAKPSETTTSDDGEQVTLMQIDPNRLQSGKYQPRRVMDEAALSELASSIGQHGVMQPIVIRPLLSNEDKVNDGVTHEIIAGERRWRAAKMAGLTQIPAIERVLSDEIAIALALIENIQREDLNVLEQAAALQRFHTEFGMSHAMIADVVGKARATVTNLLRLNNLHDTVKGYMNEGLLDMGHARALLSLSDGQQPVIAKKSSMGR